MKNNYSIEVLDLYYSNGTERLQCQIEFQLITNGALSWEEYQNIPEMFQELLVNMQLEKEVMAFTLNNEEVSVFTYDIAEAMYNNLDLPF